jgi:hypothetical protein
MLKDGGTGAGSNDGNPPPLDKPTRNDRHPERPLAQVSGRYASKRG